MANQLWSNFMARITGRPVVAANAGAAQAAQPQVATGFFAGLTFIKLAQLTIAMVIGAAAYQSVTNDIQPNKAAESQAYYANLNQMEKTKQMKILAESNPSGLAVVQQSQQVLTSSCMRLTDVSAGKGYMLARGECFTMPTTPNQIYIGAESPIISIEGGDFIVTTNDESSSCDSRQSSDRCSTWISQNQKLGGEDARLHKPRFWTLVKPVSGEVDIKTRA